MAGRKKHPRRLGLLLAFGLGLLGPLSVSAAEINLAPLFYWDTATGQGAALGPLVEFGPAAWALRPLVYRDKTRTEVLFPLASLKAERGYLFPLMTYRRDDEQQRCSFLPVIYGKQDGQAYGGVFPLYGHLENRFGYDEVDFKLWPVYSRTRRDEQITHTVLWPFLRYSPERELKIWPLYGQETTEDSTSRYALWPIIHRKRSASKDIDAVLPLYWYARSDQAKSVSVIWPFLRYSRNDARRHVSVDAPWPLVRYAEGAYHERRAFPFYWEKDLGDKYRMRTVMWPLYRERVMRSPEGDFSRRTNILILSGSSLTWAGDGQLAKTLTIWPLWHSEQLAAVTSWQLPYLLPIKHAGFKRNWEPLLTLARGSYSEEAAEADVLWRTLHYERQAEQQRYSLSFAFEVEKDQQSTRLKFMSGALRLPELKQSQEAPEE